MIGWFLMILMAAAGSGVALAGGDCAPFDPCGNRLCEVFLGESSATCPGDCPYDPVIISARITDDPLKPIPSSGDVWLTTWADNDLLYVTWGDGCGPGLLKTDPRCESLYTDCGIGVLAGTPPDLDCGPDPADCVRNRYVPDGEMEMPYQDDDKPSGLIYLDGKLVLAAHRPQWNPDEGYLAVSTDFGATWTELPGTPWTRAADSPFRDLMFINMGRNYELNTDGYVYAMAMGSDWDWEVIGSGEIYLARVPRMHVTEYGAYEYFTGLDGSGGPMWSPDPSAAEPVYGLVTEAIATAMYHPGIGRYLFLSSFGLFEAPRPWGPWVKVNELFYWGDDPVWTGGYMPGFIPKGAGPDSVYFTLAGQDIVIGYMLHLGKLQFTTRSSPCAVRLELAATHVRPGDLFGVDAEIMNWSADTLDDAAVFVVLDVAGEYFFWPSWSHYDPVQGHGIDYIQTDLRIGNTRFQVIPEFTWPDTGSDAMNGLMFYSAVVDSTFSRILGDMAVEEWGYGP